MLDFSISVLGVVALVFISIFYFSWRVWRYPKVALKLWRKSCWSKEEFEWDRKQSSGSSIGSILNRYMSPGVTPMALSVMLFFGWLVLSIFDIFMIAFLLLWLTFNLLYEIRYRHTKLRERTANAYEFFKNLDQMLIWEGLLGTGLRGSISGVMDVIMITGSFLILILMSLLSLEAFVVMFGFLGAWYILIVLIQIARRAKFRAIKSVSSILSKNLPSSLPTHVNTILAGYLTMIASFSVMTFEQIYNSKIGMILFVICSLIVNIMALLSIVFWIKRKDKSSARDRDWKSELNRDRLRLYVLLFVLGLPIALAGQNFSGLIFWIALTGSLMLLSFSDIVKMRVQKKNPKTYATIATLHLATGAYMITGSAIYIFPELSFLLEVIIIIIGVLLVLMWIQTYRHHCAKGRG